MTNTTKHTLFGIATAALVLLLVSAVLKTYRIQSSSHEQLYCNQDECYLLIGQSHTGLVGTWLADAGRAARAFLGGSTPPTHMKSEAFVLRIRPVGIERHSVTGMTMSPAGVFQDVIHVSGFRRAETESLRYTGPWELSQDGQAGLWKWTGDDFQKLSDADEARYREANMQKAFGNTKTWSSRRFNRENMEHRISLNGQPVTVALREEPMGVQYIELTSGLPPRTERIWSLDTGFRRIGRDEFVEVFGSP